MPVSTADRSAASRPAPARRLSTSALTSPSIEPTCSSSLAATCATAGDVLARALDRLLARAVRVAVGVFAHLARVLQRVALDFRGGRLRGLQDALHLRAGRRGDRDVGAAGDRRALQLLELVGERPQVRVDGGRVVAAPADREVPALDCLPIEVHGRHPRRCRPRKSR